MYLEILRDLLVIKLGQKCSMSEWNIKTKILEVRVRYIKMSKSNRIVWKCAVSECGLVQRWQSSPRMLLMESAQCLHPTCVQEPFFCRNMNTTTDQYDEWNKSVQKVQNPAFFAACWLIYKTKMQPTMYKSESNVC